MTLYVLESVLKYRQDCRENNIYTLEFKTYVCYLFYIDYFSIINGIPYEKISGNGHKRSLEKIDDYLSIEGSRIQKEHVVICKTNVYEYNLCIISE